MARRSASERLCKVLYDTNMTKEEIIVFDGIRDNKSKGIRAKDLLKMLIKIFDDTLYIASNVCMLK